MCRLCAQQGNCRIGINSTVNVEAEEVSVLYLILYCVDIDLNADSSTNPSTVCMQCIDRLQFMYNFKQFCRKNHTEYFAQQTLEFRRQDDDRIFIKNEPSRQDEYEHLLIELKPSLPIVQESARSKRRVEENRKNALRQKEKRANETAEERAERTRKTAEQARMRRFKKKLERPEEHALSLARTAELKRMRRNNLSSEEQVQMRARESEAARLRRQSWSPEQKALVRERQRIQHKERRSGFSPSSGRSSVSESIDASPWTSPMVFKSET